MAFTVGQIVHPRRRYLGRRSPYTTLASGVRLYDRQELLDGRGRRTQFGQVLTVEGAAELNCSFFDRFNAGSVRRQNWNPAAWAASTEYTAGQFVSSAGKLWECSIGGTSGSPTGPTGTGTVVDGSVTWIEALGPETELGTFSAVSGGTVYGVRVWDIDLAAFVDDYYGETDLEALTSYADWLDLAPGAALVADPTTVLPYVSAGHVDVGTPTGALADMVRAYELSGVDPRT